jgi:hypothetical protein
VFRFFENLVDPYEAYAGRASSTPLAVPVATCARSNGCSELLESCPSSLQQLRFEISYMGRLIDLIACTRVEEIVWADHGLEFFFVAVFSRCVHSCRSIVTLPFEPVNHLLGLSCVGAHIAACCASLLDLV